MYIPILKSKRGEFRALSHIDSRLFGTSLIPLIEVLSNKHRDTILSNKKLLPPVFFLDVSDPQIRRDLYSDQDLKSKIIKVINTVYDQLPGISIEGDLCIRIPHTTQEFSSLRSITNKDNIHLLIDYSDKCKDINPLQLLQNDISRFRKLFFCDTGMQYHWKSVTVAGSSFPRTMGNISQGPSFHERKEYSMLYRIFHGNYPFVQYGDYTVSHPDLIEQLDVQGDGPPHMAAKMKYSTDNGYYILKGRDLFTSQASGRAQNHYYGDLPWGHKQYLYLARKICESEYFYSEAFSWGDESIYKKATDPNEGPGNPETWIGYWTNHHIGVVLNQLANQFGT